MATKRGYTFDEMVKIAEKEKEQMRQQGDWRITPYGDVEHTTKGYLIEQDRLGDEDWILHMSRKKWVNLNEFFPVFSLACKEARINSKQIVHRGKAQ